MNELITIISHFAYKYSVSSLIKPNFINILIYSINSQSNVAIKMYLMEIIQISGHQSTMKWYCYFPFSIEKIYFGVNELMASSPIVLNFKKIPYIPLSIERSFQIDKKVIKSSFIKIYIHFALFYLNFEIYQNHKKKLLNVLVF